MSDVEKLGQIRNMTPVWGVYDCGDLHNLYATEEVAREAARKLAERIEGQYPDSGFSAQVIVGRLCIYDEPVLR